MYSKYDTLDTLMHCAVIFGTKIPLHITSASDVTQVARKAPLYKLNL